MKNNAELRIVELDWFHRLHQNLPEFTNLPEVNKMLTFPVRYPEE
jgi:hypothetical protein